MSKLIISSLMIVVGFCGCTGSIIPKSPPPQYYQLDYNYREVKVPTESFKDKILRIWEFNAKSPFDGTEMVVEVGRSGIAISRVHQWIDRPGALLSEWIRRDIDRDGMFGGAYETVEIGKEIDVELSGTVERWSLIKDGDTYFSIIEATLTVWQKKPKPYILFKKHYAIRSSPIPYRDPEAFAKAATEIAAKLSYEFRSELYKTLAKRHD
ncbi:MAG: hypothetical protein N2260_10805 [Syntrophobacterales bacterium]|nr:hypothetical protein [Syntrophobacterales bacterium]